MTLFAEQTGTIYRVLRSEDEGVWFISYSSPETPFYVAKENLWQFRRCPAPEEYLEKTGQKLSNAQRRRLELIQPLLNNPACISDKGLRSSLAEGIAVEHGTTPRRVLRLYYRYLATGQLTAKKERPEQKSKDYDWAIRTYYYSAKKFSLRATYDMMLVQRYTDGQGSLMEEAPTWSSFRHYFYSRRYHKQPKKVIARDGLTYYQRNYRPAFGSASGWRAQVGSFQMDATQADIYLVSRFDRSSVIGRPYIYLSVDTTTQLIAGIYVGLEAGETAVMRCLAHAAGDKVEYCRQYGIDISPEQWPSRGLPHEIITDKGREFLGGRMEELCRKYGIEVQSLPPFRPDRKGLVEKAFDLLQSRYKPLLRGKGVIEGDAQERWAVDYRAQAVLDLDEFTQVLLHCVVFLNSGRLLSDGRTPAQAWMEAEPQLLDVPPEELHLMALPREAVKLSRKGFRLNSLWYVPEDMDGLYLGDTYTLAYDPADLGTAYVLMGDEFRPVRCARFSGYSVAEVEARRRGEQLRNQEARRREVEASTAAVQGIQSVVEGVAWEVCGRQDGAVIRENREAERGRLT